MAEECSSLSSVFMEYFNSSPAARSCLSAASPARVSLELSPPWHRFLQLISLGFPLPHLGPAGPCVIRTCSLDFVPRRKILAGSSCTSRGIPSPAGKAEIKSSATVPSHILKNCRQGNSTGKFKFVPIKTSLCGMKHHLSPHSCFGSHSISVNVAADISAICETTGV